MVSSAYAVGLHGLDLQVSLFYYHVAVLKLSCLIKEQNGFHCLFFVGPPDEPPWRGHTSGRAAASVCGLQDFHAVTTLLCRSEGVHQDPAQRWNY